MEPQKTEISWNTHLQLFVCRAFVCPRSELPALQDRGPAVTQARRPQAPASFCGPIHLGLQSFGATRPELLSCPSKQRGGEPRPKPFGGSTRQTQKTSARAVLGEKSKNGGGGGWAGVRGSDAGSFGAAKRLKPIGALRLAEWLSALHKGGGRCKTNLGHGQTKLRWVP